jgi:hypothetical protein
MTTVLRYSNENRAAEMVREEPTEAKAIEALRADLAVVFPDEEFTIEASE